MAASRGRDIVYPDRSLALFNVHTGEKNNVVYWSDGKYVGSGLNEINWILRDFRTGEIKAIDPRLNRDGRYSKGCPAPEWRRSGLLPALQLRSSGFRSGSNLVRPHRVTSFFAE